MKNQKGITLLSLVITIVLMLIIAGTTIYTSTDRFKINNLNKLYNDIDTLKDKVDNYYLQYGGLPVLKNEQNEPIRYTFSTLNFDKNVNDDENYDILDLAAMGDFTLNYGKEGYKNPNRSDDVYVINEKTHTIYYVKGIESRNGVIYHTKLLETNLNQSQIPPTKPSINIVEGNKVEAIDENTSTIDQYETDVTLEFIPGKDNVAGISRTTYSINDSEEVNIDTLENHQYKITQNGTYEITVKTYNNSNLNSEITKIIERKVEVWSGNLTEKSVNTLKNTRIIQAGVNTGKRTSFNGTTVYTLEIPEGATQLYITTNGNGTLDGRNGSHGFTNDAFTSKYSVLEENKNSFYLKGSGTLDLTPNLEYKYIAMEFSTNNAITFEFK